MFKFLVWPALFFTYIFNKIEFSENIEFSAFEKWALLALLLFAINVCISSLVNRFEEDYLNNKYLLEPEAWSFEREKPIFYIAQVSYMLVSGALLYIFTYFVVKFLS